MIAMERSRRQPSGYVLVITSHADDARIIRDSLLAVGPEPLPVEWVSTLSEGLDRLKQLSLEAIILDLSLPDSHGIETFDKVSISAPGVAILVLSDPAEEEVAKEAVRRGAQDYLPKDRLDAYSLPRALQTVMALKIAAEMLIGDWERAEATLNSIGDAVLITDNQRRITSRALAHRMFHLALHDSLTELPNRVLLNDRLKQAVRMNERHHKKLAVLFVDLDHFKPINDSLGHAAGDAVLKSVAKRLREALREVDTVSRHGGDEFVILLPEIEEAGDAALVAEKILGRLATPHLIEGDELHVTASIGISIYPDHGQVAEVLVNRADLAMYEAKKSGGRSYGFFK